MFDKPQMVSSQREHAVDRLVRTFAKHTNYDTCDPDDYLEEIQKGLRTTYDRENNKFNYIPEDHPVMTELRYLKLKGGVDVVTGYYKHPTRNEYLYIGIGCEMGYRTNYMFGKKVYYKWMVTNRTSLGIITVWVYEGNEPEVCINKPPALSLFVLTRLAIFMNRCIHKMYSPGGNGFLIAQDHFNSNI